VFVPLAQESKPGVFAGAVIRSKLPTAALIPAIKQTMSDYEPRAVSDIDVLERIVDESILQERLMATLAGFFGGLAALLSVIGLYGVVSYSVSRRVREIGIRMALGAGATRVSKMIVVEAVELLALGVLAGLVVALLAARLAETLLYGLTPHDPVTVAMAVTLMAAVTLLAAALPARRASRVDPMVALREE